MPIPPYPELIQEWESLLTALDELRLPHLAALRSQLRRHLEKMKKAKARQESAQAARQRATQEINELTHEGLDLVKTIRGGALLQFGPRNELLVQFGMKPLRKRVRRNRTAEAAKRA